MATIQITNETSAKLFLRDFYATLEASGDANGKDVIEVERPVNTLPAMSGLQEMIADEDVSVLVTLNADEVASGLASPPNVIQAEDIAEVASTAKISPELIIYKAVTAGIAAAADDVTVYAANTLPFKFRIIDAWAYISAGASGGRTITIRSQAAGAGTSAGTLSAASTGRVDLTPASNASVVYTPGASIGVFLRRSHDAIAGEVFIKIRRES